MSDTRQVPDVRAEAKITYLTHVSDSQGRCLFMLEWDEDGRRRGQVFRADPRTRGFPRPDERG